MSPRRAAVLGSPIEHSLSPVLHRVAYAALGLDWTYEAVEMVAADLPRFIAGLGADWVGLSLTMPLKQAVIGLLGESSDVVRITGAANTVRFRSTGLRGDNTDVPALAELMVGLGGIGAQVVILGGGATARSAIAALASLGCTSVRVVARAADSDLLACADGLGVELDVADWARVGAATNDADLLISTVPAAIARDLGAGIRPRGALIDVAYDPWPTWLCARFQQAGLALATGYDLLLAQAVRQVELFTGLSAPRAAMDAAGRAELARRS